MKKAGKIVSLFFALILIASLLVACGSAAEQESPFATHRETEQTTTSMPEAETPVTTPVVQTQTETKPGNELNADINLPDGGYYRVGSTVYFGMYPQSLVTNERTIEALNQSAGELPSANGAQGWTSYNYLIRGVESNFMWYIDRNYEQGKYRGVYFTSYRPDYTSGNSGPSYSYQEDNGYRTSNVYWFKYEPIKWRILQEETGKALLLSDMIIDSQPYCASDSSSMFPHNNDTGYANNYSLSDIRKWLNETFYQVAFDGVQPDLLSPVDVINNERSTCTDRLTSNPEEPEDTKLWEWNNGKNTFACANTEDVVFLLSTQEATRIAYGFSDNFASTDSARKKKPTDYAKCQGAKTDSNPTNTGNGYWWLRSPLFDRALAVQNIREAGDVKNMSFVNSTYFGVVPALYLKLN